MRENRLCNKIGGNPQSIKHTNKELLERPESAQAAMAHAVPKQWIDRGKQYVKSGKGGRPTLYRQEIAIEVFEMLSDPKRCWTLKAISAMQGVYEQTFYEWIRAHDDLKYAVYAGKAIQEANFGSMLLHGFKYSSGVEYILTNLHNWTLKQKTEHAVDLNAAIAAQERARQEQGQVWDQDSANKPAITLVRESPKDVEPAPREDDSDYKGADNVSA